MQSRTTLEEQMEERIVHRRERVAQRLDISLREVDRLIATKQIASLKIGKRRLVSETAIQAFVRKREAAAR
jgi:excisionase family DNA binding protein